MKKVILITLMLFAVCSYAQYSIGETVLPADNISWTISGPVPYTGETGTIFDTVAGGKAVMISIGQDW